MSILIKLLPLFAILFGILFGWLFYNWRKAKAVAQALPVRSGFFLFDTHKNGEATHEGITYHYDFNCGTRLRYSRFSLAIDCPTYGHFVVHRPNFFHWVLVKMRLHSPLQTGNPVFDERFRIQTLTPALAQILFNNPEIAHQMEAIFQTGFNFIELDGKSLTATWSPFITLFQKIPQTTFVEETVRSLTRLSKKIQAMPLPQGVSKESGAKLAEHHRSLTSAVGLLLSIALLLLLLLFKFLHQ